MVGWRRLNSIKVASTNLVLPIVLLVLCCRLLVWTPRKQFFSQGIFLILKGRNQNQVKYLESIQIVYKASLNFIMISLLTSIPSMKKKDASKLMQLWWLVICFKDNTMKFTVNSVFLRKSHYCLPTNYSDWFRIFDFCKTHSEEADSISFWLFLSMC